MERFIHIRNFADKLLSESDPNRRAVLMKLLVEEEDRLGHSTEQLDLANSHIESGRRLIAR
jgi:hypothetical protein